MTSCSFGRVTYASETDASMVRDTLAVDPEVRPVLVFIAASAVNDVLAALLWGFAHTSFDAAAETTTSHKKSQCGRERLCHVSSPLFN